MKNFPSCIEKKLIYSNMSVKKVLIFGSTFSSFFKHLLLLISKLCSLIQRVSLGLFVPLALNNYTSEPQHFAINCGVLPLIVLVNI